MTDVSIPEAKATQWAEVFHTGNARGSLQVARRQRPTGVQVGVDVVSASNTTDLREPTKLSGIISEDISLSRSSSSAFSVRPGFPHLLQSKRRVLGD